MCFIDSLGCGGAQRQMVTLAKGFQQRGHEVRFLTYYAGGHFMSELQQAEIGCKCLPERGYLRRFLQVRRALRRGWQDVALAFLEAPTLYAELAGLFCRTWGLVVGERSANPKIVNGKRRWLRTGHIFADEIVTNSFTNRRMLEERWPGLRPRLSTIYNAVDLNRFRPVPPVIGSGSSRSGLRMVVMASYQPLKNMIGLAQALDLLQQQGQNMLVDWYGGKASDEHALLEARAFVNSHRLTSALRFHSPIRDVEGEYQRADVVGLFSLYEGLPNAVAEGMACGKPILTSNVCDAGYLVEDGKNGFLCDPESPASIAEGLRKLIELSYEDRRRMGMESRRRAEQLFDREVCLTKYEQVLNSALRKARRRLGGLDSKVLIASTDRW